MRTLTYIIATLCCVAVQIVAYAQPVVLHLSYDGVGDNLAFSNMPQVHDVYVARYGKEPIVRVWNDGSGTPQIYWSLEIAGTESNPAYPFPTPDPTIKDIHPYLRLRATSIKDGDVEVFKLTDGIEAASIREGMNGYYLYYRIPVNMRDYPVSDQAQAWDVELVLLDSTLSIQKPLLSCAAEGPVVWLSNETAIDSLIWVWDTGQVDDPVVADEMLKKFPHNRYFLFVLFHDRYEAKDCKGLKEIGRRIYHSITHDLDPNCDPRFKNFTVSDKTWMESLQDQLMDVCGDTLLWED